MYSFLCSYFVNSAPSIRDSDETDDGASDHALNARERSSRLAAVRYLARQDIARTQVTANSVQLPPFPDPPPPAVDSPHRSSTHAVAAWQHDLSMERRGLHSIWCNYCQTEMNHDMAANQHVLGKQHRKAKERASIVFA